jgi:hypothetical protein
MKHSSFVILFIVGVALMLVVAGCAAPEPEIIEKPVTVVVPKRETVVVPKKEIVVVRETVPAATPQPGEPLTAAQAVPFEALWLGSGHADVTAEAFRHWDEEDPPLVPASCARCHSETGYLDFVGADGSPAGVVDNDAAIGTVVSCIACHNDATVAMSTVTFPSGVQVTDLGSEARCMQCHQGRASKLTVDGTITKAGLTEVDTVSKDLGFTNIHYFAAGATKFGAEVMGGYQYDGQSYDVEFTHVDGFGTCVQCHNQHSLELRLESCMVCHEDVADVEDLKDVRMQGSMVDYDGDGKLSEGLYYEIEGVRNVLYQAMQTYASQVSGVGIVYDAASYPYFFMDPNGNGKADQDELVSENAFKAFTARLAKAAYNYQVSIKDPGAFAHNGKYIIELLYDSIADLNAGMSSPLPVEDMQRIDAGHFAGSTEPFRHWDAEGEVPGTCSKCHSASGLPFFLKEGVTASQPLANGFQCTTCHNSLPEFTRYAVESVTFPSGAAVTAGDPDNNLCLNCHQGRESTVSVNAATKGIEDDAVSSKLRFRNIHYFAAGATVFGTEVKGAYEFEGKTYRGHMVMESTPIVCLQCHSTHSLEVKVDSCTVCHLGVQTTEDLRRIRQSKEDFDGDGDTQEGIAGELETMYNAVYAAMQAYATKVAGNGIVYSAGTYPYFFNDSNNNGEADADELTSSNGFASFTPQLLRAAYNYQVVTKDPGGFTHNGKYLIQVLYDSLEALGADVSGMIRPSSEMKTTES